jgi:hypothetical protein
MRTLRRIGLLGLAGVVVASFAAPAAHADTGTAETFSATGTARALHISVLGQDATFGVTDGTVGAPLTALANAAGQLLQPATLSKVSLSSDNSSASDPTSGQPKCAVPALPDPLGQILKTDLACSLAKADITKGLPSATSTAGVAAVDVNAQNLLSGVLGNTPVGSLQLGNTVDQVQSALDPVFKAISDATSQTPVQLDPKTKISDLLSDLTTQQTLAVSLGNSTSNLTTVGNALTSASTALGGQIKILPIHALNDTPLATITVGSSKTTAAYDRAKGAGTASFDPALVTVRLANILGLQLPSNPLCSTSSTDIVCTIAPGQTLTILQGTPLESTITVADGHTTTNGKSASAVADGVSLQLFKGLSGLVPTSGANSLGTAAAGSPAAVVVELAHSESAVTGTPAVPGSSPANPAAPNAPEVKALAFTGTSPWLSVAGVALLAGFWGTRRLRRRITA